MERSLLMRALEAIRSIERGCLEPEADQTRVLRYKNMEPLIQDAGGVYGPLLTWFKDRVGPGEFNEAARREVLSLWTLIPENAWDHYLIEHLRRLEGHEHWPEIRAE